MDGKFTDQFIATIGVDFKMKSVEIGEKVCKLQLWDTMGQEKFRTITMSYYRGAGVIIIIYDITDTESFRKATTESFAEVKE